MTTRRTRRARGLALLALVVLAALGVTYLLVGGGGRLGALAGERRAVAAAVPGGARENGPGTARSAAPETAVDPAGLTLGGSGLPGETSWPGTGAGRVALGAALPAETLPAPDALLAGRVLADGARTPVQRAVVLLDDGASLSRSAETDADGRFSIPWWSGRAGRLAVTHPEFVDLRAPEAPVGEQELELLLGRSGCIAGTLDVRAVTPSGAAPGAETSAGAAGARVLAWHLAASGQRYWDHLAAAVGEDGDFLLADLVPGEYVVTALIEGGVADLVAGIEVEPGGTAHVKLGVGPGAALSGRVRARARTEPVAGAELEAVPRADGLPRDLRELRRARATTGADGSFRIADLAPGAWTAVIRLPWGEISRQDFDVPERGSVVERDFEVDGPVALAGAVLDAEGRGVDGALVAALSRGDGQALLGIARAELPPASASAVAGPGGEFRLEEVATGTRLLVLAWAPASGEGGTAERRGAPGLVAVGPLHAADPAERIEVRIPPELSILGRVLDERSEPLAGAAVLAERPLPGATAQMGLEASGSDGAFELDGQLPGRVRVTASAPGRLPAQALVDLVAGAELPALELVLAPACELRGVTLDDRGFGVAGVPVRIEPVPAAGEDPDAARRRRQASASDAFGCFRFAALAAGRYSVSAGSFEWRLLDEAPREVELPLDLPLELVLVPNARPDRAGVVGRVVLSTGDVPTGVEVRGLQGGLLEVDGGWFRATGLVPARHQLEISAEGHELVALPPFDLRPGTTHDAGLIELRPATDLVVVVRSPSGGPVNGARVRLVPLPLSAGGVGAEEPALALERLDAGRYGNARVVRAYWTLRVVHEAARTHEQTLRIDGAQQTVEVALAPAAPKASSSPGGGE